MLRWRGEEVIEVEDLESLERALAALRAVRVTFTGRSTRIAGFCAWLLKEIDAERRRIECRQGQRTSRVTKRRGSSGCADSELINL